MLKDYLRKGFKDVMVKMVSGLFSAGIVYAGLTQKIS